MTIQGEGKPMTNSEARLRELAEELEQIAMGLHPTNALRGQQVMVCARKAQSLAWLMSMRPVQADAESRSVQRRKALQRGEPMPTFEASVQAEEVGEARTNGIACPAQMNQLNGQWELGPKGRK